MYEMCVAVFSGAHLRVSNCLLDPGVIVAFIESLLEELRCFYASWIKVAMQRWLAH